MPRAFAILPFVLSFVVLSACAGGGGAAGAGDGGGSAGKDAASPEDTGSTPGEDLAPSVDAGTDMPRNRLDEPELVIVSPDDFVTAYEAHAAWRNARGVPTRVVSLSQVSADYPGRDLPERIRAAISAWHDEGARFVLLGADHPMIPRREVHCEAYNDEEEADLDEDVAAELYYADLDGDWDGDGDGRFAEREDDVDFFPDIAVGRVPARNLVELGNYLAKLRAYEDPADPAFLGRAAFLGEYAGDFGDVSLCSTVLLEPMASILPAELELTRYYTEECGGGSGSRLSTTTLQQAMWNEGVGLVLDLGHGDWYTMSQLTNHNIAQLANAERPGVYLTCECYGCEFDTEAGEHAACETFLVSTGGGVLYVGNTDFGVGLPWESPFYNLLLIHLYGNPGIRAGELYNHALSHYADGQWGELDTELSDLRWTQLTLVLMGDPSLRLWTGAPVAADVTVDEEGGELVVSVGNGEALVALYAADRFLYTAEVTAGGSARFPTPTSPYQVTVTGPSLLPWTETR